MQRSQQSATKAAFGKPSGPSTRLWLEVEAPMGEVGPPTWKSRSFTRVNGWQTQQTQMGFVSALLLMISKLLLDSEKQ